MFTNHGAHCTCVVTSGWCNAQAQGGETTYVCVGIDLNHVQTQTLLYFNAGGVQDQSAVGDLAASAQPYNGAIIFLSTRLAAPENSCLLFNI
jgi:hypothetical protein